MSSLLKRKSDRCSYFEAQNSEKFINHIYNNCYICNQNLTNFGIISKRFKKCQKCYLRFHSSCYNKDKSETEEKEQNNLIEKLKECRFCEFSLRNICTFCRKEVIPNYHILIACEFCGAKMHYNCLDIPLYLILKREYFTNLFRIYKEEEKFKAILNNIKLKEKELFEVQTQFNTYREIIKNAKTSLEAKLQTLFSVCRYCLTKENKVKQIIGNSSSEKKFYLKVSFFPFRTDIHEMFVSESIYKKFSVWLEENNLKNSLINNTNQVIKILNYVANFKKIIIKWSLGGYSMEYFDFIRNNKEFNQMNFNDFSYNSKNYFKIVGKRDFLDSIENNPYFSKNLFFLNEDEEKDKIEKAKYANNVILKSLYFLESRIPADISFQSISRPKFLILVDHYSKKKIFWKELLICQNSSFPLKIASLNIQNRNYEDKLNFEIFKKHINKETNKFIDPDVLIISIDFLNFNLMKKFHNVTINAYIFDFDNQSYLSEIEKFIKALANKGSEAPLFYIFFHIQKILPIQFNSFFYTEQDTLLSYNLIFNEIEIYNKNIKLLPKTIESYFEYILKKLNWKVYISENVIDLNFIMKELYVIGERKESIRIEFSPKYSNIISFVPVSLKKQTQDCYNNFIEEGLSFIEMLELLTFPYIYLLKPPVCCFEKIERIREIVSAYSSSSNICFWILIYARNKDISKENYTILLENFYAEIREIKFSEKKEIEIINVAIENNVDRLFSYITQKEKNVLIIYNSIALSTKYFYILSNLQKFIASYYLYIVNSIEEEILRYSAETCFKNQKIIEEDFEKVFKNKKRYSINTQSVKVPPITKIKNFKIDGVYAINQNEYIFTKGGSLIFERKKYFLSNDFYLLPISKSLSVNCNGLSIGRPVSLQIENEEKKKNLQSMEEGLKDILEKKVQGLDKLYLITNFFFQKGFNQSVRNEILNYITTFDFSSKNYLTKVNEITQFIRKRLEIKVEKKIVSFYLEMFFILLNKDYSVIDKFFFGEKEKELIKKSLLFIAKFNENFIKEENQKDFKSKLYKILILYKVQIFQIEPFLRQDNINIFEILTEYLCKIIKKCFKLGFLNSECYIHDPSTLNNFAKEKNQSPQKLLSFIFKTSCTLNYFFSALSKIFSFVQTKLIFFDK